ncbi:MAG TPA: hypothetical protein VFI49_07270 [Rudaea sp.]|nr:hypothetical protein [Rudaea sp.]
MKTSSSVGRSLHVLVLALCGLSFYAVVLVLLFLLVGLIMSTGVHARVLSCPIRTSADACDAMPTANLARRASCERSE